MAFGATLDYFGLADTIWQRQNAESTPSASNAQSMDSDGSVRCETVFAADKIFSVAYQLVKADGTPQSLDTKVKVGNIIAYDTNTKIAVTGLDVSTSNTEFPTVTVNGALHFGDTADQGKFSSGVSVIGKKKAQAIGFVLGATSRVVSSSITVSSQRATVQDEDGDFVKSVVYQGRIEASGELTACTGNPTGTADTANGYALVNLPSLSQQNTDYASANIATFKNLLPDT
jgi:hypothetical protein